MDCAAMGDNVRINTVHPGIIDTPIWPKMTGRGELAPASNAALDPGQLATASTPLGSAEVAAAVLFLASDVSSYLTASELVIDGGMFGGVVRRSSQSGLKKT